MTINQIEYFLALATHKNFTKAAESVYTSQPNLSRQIAALEKELEHQLFIRDKHSIELTPVGEILLARGKNIMENYKEALSEIKNIEQSVPISFGIMDRKPLSE